MRWRRNGRPRLVTRRSKGGADLDAGLVYETPLRIFVAEFFFAQKLVIRKVGDEEGRPKNVRRQCVDDVTELSDTNPSHRQLLAIQPWPT